MWYNQLPSNKHQIIHPYAGPILPAPTSLSIARRSSHLPRPVQEKPYKVSFLHPAAAARHVLPIEEGEGEDEFGLFDRFLDLEVFFSQAFF